MDKTTDTTFIGYINPLRYRGYYYDSETGLYYLNARYYDPEVGRFISADETLDGGYNLFAYCHNNPMEFVDYTGKAPICIGHTMSGPGLSKLPNGCKGYNCYWWALNRIAGSFNITDPPGMENRGVLHTMWDLAIATTRGIMSEGAHAAAILTTLDDRQLQAEISSLAPNQYLIAMRLNPVVGGDYHYMRLEADGTWTHKQGSGGYLYQLNGNTPNDDAAWLSYDGNPFTGASTLLSPTLKYSSQTWYIRVTI